MSNEKIIPTSVNGVSTSDEKRLPKSPGGESSDLFGAEFIGSPCHHRRVPSFTCGIRIRSRLLYLHIFIPILMFHPCPSGRDVSRADCIKILCTNRQRRITGDYTYSYLPYTLGFDPWSVHLNLSSRAPSLFAESSVKKWKIENIFTRWAGFAGTAIETISCLSSSYLFIYLFIYFGTHWTYMDQMAIVPVDFFFHIIFLEPTKFWRIVEKNRLFIIFFFFCLQGFETSRWRNFRHFWRLRTSTGWKVDRAKTFSAYVVHRLGRP